MSPSGPQSDGTNAAPAAAAPQLDLADILAAVGDVAYDWRIGSDALAWSRNVTDVLLIRDVATISTGRGYAQLLEAENAQARFDAIVQSGRRDDGSGVAYQFNTPSVPNPAPPPSCGSRIPDAGSPDPMAGRTTPTNSFASSPSVSSTSAGSPTSPAMTA